MAATLPGSVGWPITGDKTIEFTRNPDDFVHSCVKTYSSKIFQTRMLNKPHVFVTSSQGVKELLEDKQEHFEMGYKDFGFMHSLFGDLILFCNYNEASRLHKILHSLVKPEAMMRHLTDVDIVCSRNLDGLHNRENIVLYRLMKHLTTEISLTLFLGLDFEVAKSNASEIVDLTVAHWHGLISVPFNINVYGYKSGYGKAMKAKEHLLQVIEEQLSRSKNGFVKAMKEAEFHTQREAANHLLLFVSALVPKALASLLTSFCLELSKKANFERRRKAKEDDRYLDHVLYEVKRLWPPFLGGRRIAKKRVVLDGYQIPQGFSVGYFTKPANCDPKIFPEPERFYPERWDTWNKNDLSRVWTFGGGPRGCVGSAFIHRILKLVAKYLLQFYEWTVPEGQDLSYKWLPVSRPRNEVKIVFRAVSS